MLPNVTAPTTYGAPKDNRRHVVDPRTEFSYTEIEALLVDMAAATHVLPRAWATVDAAAGGGSVLDHDAVWGDTAAPTLTRNGAGDYTLTWAVSYVDLNPTPARQVTNTLALKTALVSLQAQGTFYVTVPTVNTVRVYTFNAAGAAADIDFSVFAF